ncbi:MAG: NAD-dependent epimerase/dehydratase family protein [Lachnospiraceae bacterium]|nr:NAD-dependent epimerase/dehydratase family protein [Lachnospiraceae bacterium]
MEKKNILITGKNSYIGNMLSQYLEKEYKVQLLSVRGTGWKKEKFGEFDVVVHCAAIVHKKEKRHQKEDYIQGNYQLTKELAEKSKKEGVKQFIFLSSMSVYGLEEGVVGKDTKPQPKSLYGKSKWLAEKAVQAIESEEFQVVILRLPMVYGKGAKGNYKKLVKLAVKIPVFPAIKNQRSMIYIGNLCELIKKVIERKARGIFYPQDREYVSTAELVRQIGKAYGREIRLVKWMNPFAFLCMKSRVGKKVFGNLVYQKGISECGLNGGLGNGPGEGIEYQIIGFQESFF